MEMQWVNLTCLGGVFAGGWGWTGSFWAGLTLACATFLLMPYVPEMRR